MTAGASAPGRGAGFEIAAWLLLLTCAALLRLVDLGERTIGYDEGIHAQMSWRLYDHGGYAHHPMTHGPLLYHLNAAIYALFGDTDRTARLLPALVGTALVATPWLFRRWLGRRGALAAGFMIAVAPDLWHYSRYLREDIYVALATALWAHAILRYTERPAARWAWQLAAALTVSLASKESTFLTGAIFGGWCVFGAIVSAWRGRGLRGPPGDLAILMLTLVLPYAAPVWLLAVGIHVGDGMQAGPVLTLLAFGGSLLAAALVAWLWWRRAPDSPLSFLHWTALNGAVWAVLLVLYSRGLNDVPGGLATGTLGSVGYWLEQQGVARGGQPADYYPFLLLHYAPGMLLLGLVGAVVALRRTRWRGHAFFLVWCLGSLAALTAAGEKMPWLLCHISLPLAFVAGQAANRLLDLRKLALPKVLLLAPAAVLLAFSTAAGCDLNFRSPNKAEEYLVYAQGGHDLRWIRDQLALAGQRWPEARALYDGDATWPLVWYLRHQPHQGQMAEPTAEQTDGAAAVVLTLGSRVPENLRRWAYVPVPVDLLVWPEEDYRAGGVLSRFRERFGAFLAGEPPPGTIPLRRSAILYLRCR